MLEPAGFGIRFAAQLLDLIVTSLIGLVAGAIGGILAALLAMPGWQDRVGEVTPMGYLISFGASIVYHTLAEGLGGATIGKAICGLRVLTEQRQPCTIGKALVRSLGYYVDGLFFGLVAWSSMSRSPTKQRLGDKWAGTIVVHNRSAQSLALPSPALGMLVSVAAYAVLHIASVVLRTG